MRSHYTVDKAEWDAYVAQHYYSLRGSFSMITFSWRDFRNEFKQGGCVNLFFRETADALNPFTPSLTTAAEPAAASIAAVKYNSALRYAMSRPNLLGGRGLIYPMKSGVVRSMVADANAAAGAGALLTLDLAIIQGLWAEGRSIANGDCH